MAGTTSLSANSRAVCAISRCSSDSRSGVSTDAGSLRLEQPRAAPFDASSRRHPTRSRLPPRPFHRRRTSSPARSEPSAAAFRRSRLVVSLAPVQPRGWPSAIAPPLTLRRSSSIGSSRRHASTCAANASFSSMRSMSSSVSPACFENLPDGRNRSDAESLRRHAGRCVRHEAGQRSAGSSLAREAFGCDEHGRRAVARLRRIAGRHGAVDVKGGSQLRQRLDRCVAPRAFVRCRTFADGDAFRRESVPRRSPQARADDCAARTRPALRARCCGLARDFRRQVPSSDTRRDSDRPVLDSARSCCRPSGTRLMLSVPPAMIAFAEPPRMRSAANAMACRPDAQNRLTVTADASTGIPARRLAMRATLSPCSASGIAQPRITSSISAAATPAARLKPSRMTIGGELVGTRRSKRPAWRLSDRRAHRRDDQRVSHRNPAADPRWRRPPRWPCRRTGDWRRR